jgi:hypothetical protein
MSPPRISEWTWLCRCAVVSRVAIGVALAQQDTSGKAAGNGAVNGIRVQKLRGIHSGQMFNNFNRNDARAVLKTWYDVLGQQKGFIPDSQVDVLDSVTAIRERLQSHTVELLMLSIPDYLELESSRLVTPHLTDTRGSQGERLYSYVIASQRTIGFNHRRGPAREERPHVLTRRREQRPGMAQCSSRQREAGAKEMNPQLGKLRVLARSRPMVESIIATPVESLPYRNDVIEAMLSLHQSPRGRQLLTVFKTDRLVRLQPGDLDAAREPWKDYYRLPGSSPNRLPASAGLAESTLPDREKERY